MLHVSRLCSISLASKSFQPIQIFFLFPIWQIYLHLVTVSMYLVRCEPPTDTYLPPHHHTPSDTYGPPHHGHGSTLDHGHSDNGYHSDHGHRDHGHVDHRKFCCIKKHKNPFLMVLLNYLKLIKKPQNNIS